MSEAGLYRLIARSKMKVAEAFQDWVEEEVLPSIRKTGCDLHHASCDTGLSAVLGTSSKHEHLTDGIRVDQATQKGFVYDVIHLICRKPGNYASQNFSRLQKAHSQLTPFWCRLKTDGKGN